MVFVIFYIIVDRLGSIVIMSFSTNLGEVFSNYSFLLNQLCNFRDNFNVGHENLRSYNLSKNSFKIHELTNILEEKDLNIFGVTESWLKPTISNEARKCS